MFFISIKSLLFIKKKKKKNQDKCNFIKKRKIRDE
jgi:hypothetical protein